MVNEKKLLTEIICAMSLADLGALYDRYINLYAAVKAEPYKAVEAFHYSDTVAYLAAELENRRK